MKRILLAFACTALALSGCIQDEVLDNGSGSETAAIEFGTYIGRSAATRATVITSETLKGEGFGVNAWYTGLEPFDPASLADYDVFMNNTRVAHDGTAWAYSPLKYWPNNPNEMVSFVAYAPYNMVTAADGSVSEHPNIKVNGTDVTYTVANEVKDQVDLLWSDSSEIDYNTIDLKKQKVDDRVTFLFKHALSKVNLKVGALIDMVEDDTTDGELGSDVLAPETEIKVKKVVLMGDEEYSDEEGWLTADGPFYTGGTLSLMDGSWSDQTAGQRFEFTADHFIGNADFVLGPNNSNYLNDLLNDESYLMIIPQDLTTGGFKIYIEYDVITQDEAVSDGSVVVENRITSADAITSIDFEQGKQYNINMILGMTTVKFDVEVLDWDPADDENSDNPANTGDVVTPFVLLEKDNILANLNDTGSLSPSLSSELTKSLPEFMFSSDNDEIVSIDESGNYSANALGKAMVTVSCDGYEPAICVIEVLPSITNSVILSQPIATSNIPAENIVWEMGNSALPHIATHRVQLSRNFFMSQYETTVGQYVEFLNAVSDDLGLERGEHYEYGMSIYYATNDYEDHWLCREDINHLTYSEGMWTVEEGYENYPVQVTWDGAYLFADAVGGALPTEAQWEYACRAGDPDLNKSLWWESEIPIRYADWMEFDSVEAMEEALVEFDKYECVTFYKETADSFECYRQELRPVTETVKSNAWGLYDLYAGVSELCANYDYVYPVSDQVTIDPAGTNYNPDNMTKAVRGSSYVSSSYTQHVNENNDWIAVWLTMGGDSYSRDAMAHDYTNGFRMIFYDTASPNINVVKNDNIAPASL